MTKTDPEIIATEWAKANDYTLVANDVWRDAKKALEIVEKIKRLTVTYAQTGNKPTRTISMEELKEFLK